MNRSFNEPTSIAYKNILVLLFSFLPFVLGISFTLYMESDNIFFSRAINVSGSQRMRTMLIANYSQQYAQGGVEKVEKILESEIKRYEQYYYALIDGDKFLKIDRNRFDHIVDQLKQFQPLLHSYKESGNTLLADRGDEEALNFILNNAMDLKNRFHDSTQLFQKFNDDQIKLIGIVNTVMIIFALMVTIVGFSLSRKIKWQERAFLSREKDFRVMVSNSRDAIAVRKHGKIIFGNSALSKILSIPLNELENLDESRIFTQSDIDGFEDRFYKNRYKDDYSTKFQTKILHESKGEIELEIVEKNIEFRGDKAQILLIRDVTKINKLLKLSEEREQQIKGLDGFIPICASCNLIRDDEKEFSPWVKPADYIVEKVPDIKFSHTICPNCEEQLYPFLKKKRSSE